jgi:F0F1-type ATP synthase assembly protein I
MAIKMALVIAAGVYGGMALDERYGGKTPWFTLGLSLIGVGAAVYIVIKEAS